jgi:hypothetical protein
MASIAPNTICSRTAKGLAEVRNKSGKLSRENGIVLQCIDGKKRLNELQAALAMTMAHLLEAIETLIAQGFVHEVAAVRQTEVASVRQTVAKNAPEDDDLDFSSPEAIAEFNRQTEIDARGRGDNKKQDTEAKKRAAAEAKQRAEAEAKKRAEAEVKKRAEVEAKQRVEAEAKKRAAAEEKQRAEAEARKRAEAEASKRAEAEAKQRADDEAKKRAEAERQAREEAERKAREEAERKAREEAERKAREEAERKAREEAERKAREEAERKAREEAERRAREEAERREREEAERKAREEAERREREEALRREREEAARREREEAERRAREEAELREREEALHRERQEAARREREDAERRAREEAELRQREEALRREREELQEREQATASTALESQSQPDTQAPAPVPAEPSAAHDEPYTDEVRVDTNATAETQESGEAAPDQSAVDLVRKLKAKVKAERHARVHAERWSTQAPSADPGLNSGGQSSEGMFPDRSHPTAESSQASTGWPGPAEQAQSSNFAQETDASGHAADAASALERAMLDAAAQNSAGTYEEPTRQLPETHSESPAQDVGDPPPREFRAMDEAAIPIADDVGPLHQRVNGGRAAHDVAAEAASARQHDQSRVFGTHAAGDRLHDVNEDARRASRVLQKKRRARVLATLGVLLVAAPVLGALCLQFIPLNGYIPDAQQALSERFKQPTKITTLRYVLLPSPRVVLEGVTVGNGIHVDRIEAPALPYDLSAVPRAFDVVSAHGVTIDAETLGTIPYWTAAPSGTSMRVHRVKLEEVKLNAADSELTALKGEATFKPDGTLHQAFLGSEKLRLDVAPVTNGLRLVLTARDSRIPFGPGVKFNEFTISGVAEEQRFTSTELSGRIAGGSLEGTLKASWNGPVVVNGEFKVQKLRLEELVPLVASDIAVNGVLTASGRFALQSPTADGLMMKPRVEASFSLARGELTNLDLVRATQSSGSSSFGGGRTSFEEAKGTLKIADGQYDYRLQLSSGPLNANGAFAVNPAGQLSGRITTELAARSAEVTRTALKVVGTFKEPQLAH